MLTPDAAVYLWRALITPHPESVHLACRAATLTYPVDPEGIVGVGVSDAAARNRAAVEFLREMASAIEQTYKHGTAECLCAACCRA